MCEEEILELCKLDIGAAGSHIYDPWFTNSIHSAKEDILKEGIKLDFEKNYSHVNYIVMYVHWLWDRRDNPSLEMPRALRYNLNNEKFHQDLREVEND